jgi:hypothetical protein
MGSMETGELLTEEQYQALYLEKRTELKIVGINPEESAMLQGMNRKQRRDWMRKNKKFSRRQRDVQATQAR